MKNARIKLLAFVMMLVMIVSVLMLPASADTANSNVEPASVEVNRVPADVRGKTVTLDGVKSAEEGWSSYCFSYMSSKPSKWNNNPDHEAAEIYLAADAEYLYVYGDGKTPIYRAWMVLQLDPNHTRDTTSGGEDKFLDLRLFGTLRTYNPEVQKSQDPDLDGLALNCNKATNSNYTGKNYAFSGTKHAFNSDMSAFELKIPMSDYMRELIKKGSSFGIGFIIATGNDEDRFQDSTYNYDWSKGSISIKIPAKYMSSHKIVDNSGKHVTVDGVRKAEEGWTNTLFSYMNVHLEANGGMTGYCETYISSDKNNLYVFIDGKKPIYETYFLIQLDKNYNKNTDSTEAYDKVMQMRVSGTSSRSDMLNCCDQGENALSYINNPDYAFGGTTYWYNNDKSALEIKIPLPEWVKDKLLKDDFYFNVASLVRWSDGGTGYNTDRMDAEIPYSWISATIATSISKCESDSSVAIEGFQTRKSVSAETGNPTADIRFVATLKEEDISLYENIGFEITYNEKTGSKNSRYVYSSLKAGNRTIVAGEGDYADAAYFFCYTISEIEAGDYFFTVRAYNTRKDDNVTRYGEKALVSFSVDSNGELVGDFTCFEKYSIVIPQNADINEQTLAKNIREYILNIYSYQVPIKTDADKKSEYEILIGNTSRTNIEAKQNCYTVSVDNKTIQLVANGMLGYENLAEYFKDVLLGTDVNTGSVLKDGYYYESEPKTSLEDGTQFVTNKYGDIRVMLYNVYGYSSSGPIDKRQQYQIEILKAYKPDVFGAQEYSKNYTANMTGLLNNIGYTQVPAEYSTENNFTPLFYNAKTVKYIDGGYVLYPLKNDQGLDINDVKSKSLTWAVFEIKSGENAGERFAVISTHFMYGAKNLTAAQANEARCIDAREMLETVVDIQSEYGQIPVIAGGDLNCKLKDDPCKILTDAGLLVAQKQATVKNDNEGHHGYAEYYTPLEHYSAVYVPKNTYESGSIDHIFVTPGTNVAAFGTLFNDYTLYSSDHSPVMVDIAF